MVKVYLLRKDVPFTEHNVSIDREGLKQLVAMGYRTTPVTTIGEHRIVGYSPPKLDAALKDSGIEV